MTKLNFNIMQYGMTGSGSTVVWQVLNRLYPNNQVLKTHNYFKQNGFKAVVTLRDFRDFFATIIRRDGIKLGYNKNIEDINKIYYKNFLEQYGCLIEYKKNYGKEDILFIRYEEFVSNFDFLCDAIQEFFGQIIPKEERNFIKNEYSIENNRIRSDNLHEISHNEQYKIYQNHVTDGTANNWQRYFDKEVILYLNKLLEKELNQWGFII